MNIKYVLYILISQVSSPKFNLPKKFIIYFTIFTFLRMKSDEKFNFSIWDFSKSQNILHAISFRRNSFGWWLRRHRLCKYFTWRRRDNGRQIRYVHIMAIVAVSTRARGLERLTDLFLFARERGGGESFKAIGEGDGIVNIKTQGLYGRRWQRLWWSWW